MSAHESRRVYAGEKSGLPGGTLGKARNTQTRIERFQNQIVTRLERFRHQRPAEQGFDLGSLLGSERIVRASRRETDPVDKHQQQPVVSSRHVRRSTRGKDEVRL
jgi:hypothetical protein